MSDPRELRCYEYVNVAYDGVREALRPLGDRKTELELALCATSAAGLFPSMEATLSLYPLSAHETRRRQGARRARRPPHRRGVGAALRAGGRRLHQRRARRRYGNGWALKKS